MLDLSRITYTLQAEPEDLPIRGNASAMDDDTDKETEEWIYRQLRQGNEWAWCSVKVTASYPGLPAKGVNYLGCCSYLSEEDFKRPGGYFEDMKNEAKADLLKQLEQFRSVLCA